jgi:radical SAM PhpK family P-methyltransferase
MTDCLIIGFNDTPFEDYVKTVTAMGADSGAYKDLNLAFIEHDGRPYHAMGILNRFYGESVGDHREPFSNVGFLWPVITYLGSFLSRHGQSFDYVNLFQKEKDRLKEKLLHDDILTIAITTTLYVSVEPILEIVSFLRAYNRKAKIIVGGPHIHNQAVMLDEDALRAEFEYIGADIYVISQEGEGTLVDVINALKNGSSLAEVNNIAYREGSRFVRTPAAAESNSLEGNMVDYRLFPRDDFGEFVSLRTAKSCPFSCAFCGFPTRAGKYTYLGVDLVESEFNAIRDIGGVTTLTFTDDTFNVPKPRFKELMRMMIRNSYGFKWNSYLRCDHVDEECVELMQESGCEGVFLGMESGSETILREMNKTARARDYLRVIPLLRQAGIVTHANLIIGFPGETMETVRETVEVIEEARPDFYRAQLWYADSTTPVWNRREELGIKGSCFNWSHRTMDAATASALVDELFLSVRDSTWLPQRGFEHWSLFYLQRKGMSFERMRTFIQCFNAAVKEKLIYPHKREVDPRLMEALRASCRFKDPKTEARPLVLFSASEYAEAEKYWTREYASLAGAGGMDHLRDAKGNGGGGWKSVRSVMDASVVARLTSECGAGLSEVVLAAYAILLARVGGGEDVVLVLGLPEEGGSKALPIRLRVPWNSSYREMVERVRHKIREARVHQRYAFAMLTSPVRMAKHGTGTPALALGYAFRSSGKAMGGILDEALAQYPGVLEKIDLVLEVHEVEREARLALCYRGGAFRAGTIASLSGCLSAILEGARDRPDGTLEDMTGPEVVPAGPVTNADASERFDFS